MQSSRAFVFVFLLAQPVTLSTGYPTAGRRNDDVSLSSLQTLVQQQATVIQSLQSQLTVNQNRLAQTESRLTALESSDQNQNAHLSKSVAFTVRFTGDPAPDVGTHAILKFDLVNLNIGAGYDPHTGIFTIPVSGVYVFFVSLMSHGHASELSLKVDGQATDYVHANDDMFDQGTLLETIHLRAGQKVWVQHWVASTDIKGGSWTDFSGFLLKAD